MSISIKLKVLAGAVALAIGGTAVADTSAASGDLLLNIVDTTNSTSFLYDTGLTLATFSSTGSYTYNFATDANYTSFLKTGDVLEYSVVAGTISAGAPAPGTVFFTANAAVTPVTATVGANITQAATGISGFVTGANATTSSTTNSALLSGSAQWGAALNEGLVSTNLFSLASGLGAAPGTALSFYSEVTVNPKSATIAAALTTFAGTWNLNGGVLTYSAGTTPVPLPTPLLLLLSGLGLMGVVTRRGKGAVSDFMSGAAA